MNSEAKSIDERPIAYPIRYELASTYVKTFHGSGFGLVLEDTGETCFLYVTDESSKTILDALHLYSERDKARPRPGDRLFIVWNPGLQKTGLFYKDRFIAAVDFKNRLACCRSGLPTRTGEWCKSSHMWDDQMIRGLSTSEQVMS